MVAAGGGFAKAGGGVGEVSETITGNAVAIASRHGGFPAVGGADLVVAELAAGHAVGSATLCFLVGLTQEIDGLQAELFLQRSVLAIDRATGGGTFRVTVAGVTGGVLSRSRSHVVNVAFTIRDFLVSGAVGIGRYGYGLYDSAAGAAFNGCCSRPVAIDSGAAFEGVSMGTVCNSICDIAIGTASITQC